MYDTHDDRLSRGVSLRDISNKYTRRKTRRAYPRARRAPREAHSIASVSSCLHAWRVSRLQRVAAYSDVCNRHGSPLLALCSFELHENASEHSQHSLRPFAYSVRMKITRGTASARRYHEFVFMLYKRQEEETRGRDKQRQKRTSTYSGDFPVCRKQLDAG